MSINSVPEEETKPFIDVSDDEETFESMAATMPETAQGFLSDASPVDPVAFAQSGDDGDGVSADATAPTPQERKAKRIKMSKKMQKSMDKLKAKTAKFPVMWFNGKSKEHPEWALDKDEEDLLTDSIETVFEILDIELQIEPLTMTLTSIWWVLSYPLLAFAFLFFTKQSQIQQKEQQEGAEQPTNAE